MQNKNLFKAKNTDIYDILTHASFNLDIKTRSERVLHAEDLEFILERYKKRWC